jgi:hypothetical protein
MTHIYSGRACSQRVDTTGSKALEIFIMHLDLSKFLLAFYPSLSYSWKIRLAFFCVFLAQRDSSDLNKRRVTEAILPIHCKLARDLITVGDVAASKSVT